MKMKTTKSRNEIQYNMLKTCQSLLNGGFTNQSTSVLWLMVYLEIIMELLCKSIRNILMASKTNKKKSIKH